ncbi:MAG: polysaccharide export protein [Bradyrhizobium sp.]|nr:polysaccharide export protein [Bradyrhizobium sp.]
MAPVRFARAFRWSIKIAALAGCVAAAGSGASAQGRNDLDYMTYGQPGEYAAPQPPSDGGGAIAALRRALSGASRPTYNDVRPPAYASAPATTPPTYAPAPVAAPTPYDAYAAAPVSAPVRYDAGYRLDAGDKLRVVVFGQDGLTNTYTIDAAGSITMPLIGQVPARGRSPASLAAEITGRLRNGYIREPSVAVEIESYRPFFILGEVQAPGQYPYVPNMTVESAIAIAGGFSPRARRDLVTVTHADASGIGRYLVPLGTALGPGDTVQVGERWF